MAKKEKKEKKPMSKTKKTILIILAVILVVAIGYCVYFFGILSVWEPKTSLKETNTNPVIYDTLTDMKKQMGDKYPYSLRIEQEWYGYTDEQMDETLLAVPGMEATKTKTAKGKVAMCTSMTPQGIVACDEGIFISAYCHTHKHNSVIYYVDWNGKLISTITLETKSHVGGLAYDDVNKVLWVSEKKDKKAALGGLNISSIKAYNDKTDKPIKYDQFVKLQGIRAASYITYYNGAVWVGLFNAKDKGKLMEFQIAAGGILDGKADFTMKTDEKIQGLYICDDYTVMSKSYGPFDSKLLIFVADDSADAIKDVVAGEESALMVMDNPPKLEQIGTIANRMYFLFESSAFCYRQRGSANIDRVTAYNLTEPEDLPRLMELMEKNSKYDNEHLTINEDVYNYLVSKGILE